MTKQQAISAMQEGKKITHTYFGEDEYMEMKGNIVQTEDGCIIPEGDFWAMRTSDAWESGYEIFEDKQTLQP